MGKKYQEYKQLDLTTINTEIFKYWEENNIFENSLKLRKGSKEFIFYEGPPSANGQPGIHHVMARAIKDIFCRYKSMKGFYVARKAGWDTHGLPVELGVEKNLGITKEDIGKKISVDEYNAACRAEVMKYKDLWDKLTKEMGYWVDLENPYITFKNEYIETLWFLIGELYKKGLLYKGYTIQPFSPAAGTGLSSHELNMPGCYRDVKDTTMVAQFKIKTDKYTNAYFLAWTTTPWTLPSNTALAVGNNIDYLWVDTFNPYTAEKVIVVLAKPLMASFFNPETPELPMEYSHGDKVLPYRIIKECKGKDLVGIEYEQLLNWIRPQDKAFRVIAGDFVTTDDGTGIVHIAPTFGADDDRVAKQNGIPPLVLIDKEGKRQPMVDRTGKFYSIEDLDNDFIKESVNVDSYSPFAGKFVKNAYDKTLTEKDISLDVEIALYLKQEGKAFKIEKHTHSYPHCWRTDKPILYYPLDSWFIRTTALQERMIELNKTINWKPESTGTGRFGNWLENLVDWNLSRSRYWGTPLPIWRTEDGSEEICISSVDMLRNEIEKSVEKGYMKENKYASSDYNSFDLHRPYIDDVVLVSANGNKMFRETDLIDVWFDSGAMPFAQMHYPFSTSKKELMKNFPADFIAEGVDQTRGWFFTLHAIATLVFDSVSFKNVVSNGLVLDKNGNKMSKRLGNAVDPFEVIGKYGADATRWYMVSNSQPWENLKFDIEGVDEVRRKLFGTLYNTYSFFALYANIDSFVFKEEEVPYKERPEIDRWILSELNSLVKMVDESYNDYEPTKAARAIGNFVDEYLSNWYVRLCRRRFWKGEYTQDKISAYQTLYTCLEVLSQLMAPIAPFFAEKLFLDLNEVSNKYKDNNQNSIGSVHFTDFPTVKENLIDKTLEERMQLAQKICSMVLSLRKRNNLKVRQPLQKIMIPALNEEFISQIEKVKELILSEVNIKGIEFLSAQNNVLVKKAKADFKSLGPKYGQKMKAIANAINAFSQEDISEIEREGKIYIDINGEKIELLKSDVEIVTQDIPGWVVMNEGAVTVALDTTITDSLRKEAIARELVNRIQNIRKEQDFEVTDFIIVEIEFNHLLDETIEQYSEYIKGETLTRELSLVRKNDIEVYLGQQITKPISTIDVIEGVELAINIRRV
ncbi:Isoleucine--tRNA ligase [bioreactor metagenome]|uniref:isoleucine--tRNA ligase n=1 Tax=bioreactor metagenome TaxID=1076179 RepID=A0A644VLH8_9ZZZZ